MVGMRRKAPADTENTTSKSNSMSSQQPIDLVRMLGHSSDNNSDSSDYFEGNGRGNIMGSSSPTRLFKTMTTFGESLRNTSGDDNNKSFLQTSPQSLHTPRKNEMSIHQDLTTTTKSSSDATKLKNGLTRGNQQRSTISGMIPGLFRKMSSTKLSSGTKGNTTNTTGYLTHLGSSTYIGSEKSLTGTSESLVPFHMETLTDEKTTTENRREGGGNIQHNNNNNNKPMKPPAAAAAAIAASRHKLPPTEISSSVVEAAATLSSSTSPVKLLPDTTYTSKFMGDAKSQFSPGRATSMGLDDTTGIFAVDAISQLCIFATCDGDLKLISPDFEISLTNNSCDVKIHHILPVPGVNRIVTAGNQYLKRDTDEPWIINNDVTSPYISLLQIWDYSQLFPGSAKFMTSCKPVTVKVPYTILCLERVKHCKSLDSAKLYRQCVREFEAATSPPSAIMTSTNLGEQPGGVQVTGTSLRSDIHTLGGVGGGGVPSNKSADVALRFFTHPDNSPIPIGDPSADSRWLFFLGTSEGDVRLFDAWSYQFLDYLISSENVCQQLVAANGIPEDALKLFHIDRLTSLPGVKCVAAHPIEPTLILIGYANALVVEWDLLKHKVVRSFCPFPSQSIKKLQSASTLQKDTKQNAPDLLPRQSRVSENAKPSGGSGNSRTRAAAAAATTTVHTTVVPVNFDVPQSPLFLHSMSWHQSGFAFVTVISSISVNARKSDKLALSPIAVLVFSAARSLPAMVISLEHSLRSNLDDVTVPFIYWEPFDRHFKSKARPSGISFLMQGRLYLLLAPITRAIQAEANAVMSWLQMYKKQPRMVLGAPSTILSPRLSNQPKIWAVTQEQKQPQNTCNLWRLSGQHWSHGMCVFPSSISSSNDSTYGFLAAQLVLPAIYQSPAVAGYPFAGSLCGLRLPLDIEIDRGEDADTVVEAANKLSKYFLGGSFILVLTDCPTRRLMGACLKIDKNKFSLLSRLYPHPVPTVRKGRTTSTGSLLSEGIQQTTGTARSVLKDTEKSDFLGHRSGAMRSLDLSKENDAESFAPWETQRVPICFQVDWQSLACSNVSACVTIPKPRLLGGDSDSTQPYLPLAGYRLSQTGVPYSELNNTTSELAIEKHQAFERSGQQMHAEAWKSLIDALYTVRRKHVIHGWLSGLAGKANEVLMVTIPRNEDNDNECESSVQEDVLSSTTIDQELNKNNRSSNSSSTLGPPSSDEDDEETTLDANEWNYLNETRFFGDLIRVANSSWGFSKHFEISTILITGHIDGKVRIFGQSDIGTYLLHDISIVSPSTALEQADKKKSKAAADTSDEPDMVVVAGVDSRPVVRCVPNIPIVTCVRLYMPDHDPFRLQQTTTFDFSRYLAVGCITGEVVVFRWSHCASNLSPMETREWLKAGSHESRMEHDVSDAQWQFLEKKADELPTQTPFGFVCIARILIHKARITAMQIVSNEAPVSTLLKEDVGKTSRIGLLANLGQKSKKLQPQGREIKVTTKLIIGDGNGLMSIVELPTGRLVSALLPLGPSSPLGSLYGQPQQSSDTTITTTSSNLHYNKGITAIVPLPRPILISSKFKLDFSESNLSTSAQDVRYLLVTYLSSILRIVDVLKNKFIDDDGNYSKYVIRLDTFGLSPKPLTIGPSSHEGTPQLKFLLWEELRIDFVDYWKMCLYLQSKDSDWPHLQLSDTTTTEGIQEMTARVRWTKWTESSKARVLDKSLGVFAVATSRWIGLFECKVNELPIPSPFLLRQITLIDLHKEVIHASLSYVDNLPCLIVQSRPDALELYAIYFNQASDLTLGLISNGRFSKNSSTPSTSALYQVNWSRLDWAGGAFFGRKTKEANGSSLFFSTLFEMQQRQRTRCIAEAWNRLKQIAATHSQRMGLLLASEAKKSTSLSPRLGLSASLATPSSLREKNNSKGWASSLIKKLSHWATEHTKPATLHSLRVYIKSAPRDCLTSARDLRLRRREVSYALSSTKDMEAIEIPQRFSSYLSNQGDDRLQSRVSIESSQADNIATQEDANTSVVQRPFDLSSPRSFLNVGSDDAEKDRKSSGRSKTGSWSTYLFAASPKQTPVNKLTSRDDIHFSALDSEIYSQSAKADPWQAAQNAKHRLEANRNLTQQYVFS